MAEFVKFTEEPSRYRHLEQMSVADVLANINKEDKSVPIAVEKAIPQIEKLVNVIVDNMLAGKIILYRSRNQRASWHFGR